MFYCSHKQHYRLLYRYQRQQNYYNLLLINKILIHQIYNHYNELVYDVFYLLYGAKYVFLCYQKYYQYLFYCWRRQHYWYLYHYHHRLSLIHCLPTTKHHPILLNIILYKGEIKHSNNYPHLLLILLHWACCLQYLLCLILLDNYQKYFLLLNKLLGYHQHCQNKPFLLLPIHPIVVRGSFLIFYLCPLLTKHLGQLLHHKP